MNIDLIPCEICRQQFPPDQYIIHITTHSPNDSKTTNSSFNPNSSNTNHHNTNNTAFNTTINTITPIIDTIPCDQCLQQIPLSEFDSHTLMHSLSTSNSNTNQNTVSNPNTIPCSHCNQQIPITQYETHQLSHIDETTLPPTNTNRFIQCEYPNCSTKWIPTHEYNDHITLHKLQSQQPTPNTSNDAMLALHTQTQLIQQQTATLKNSSGRPDPRRICSSNAFIHLSDTQRPVIPMHDSLITQPTATHGNNNHGYTHSNRNASSLPPRDNHNVAGIIRSLEHVLSGRNNIEYYLCDELLFYYRDREDYSWGCGFRNCQTLTSVLVNNKSGLYNKYIHNGVGFVPSINTIQKYLDYAHAQGFDPEGLKELGQTYGTRQWIGAVDVAALLRSWSIPACIFDFQLGSNDSYHDDMFEWVWEYFVQRYKYYGVDKVHDGNGGNGGRNNVNGQRLISSYFQSGNGGNDDDVMMKKVLEMSKRESKVKRKGRKKKRDNKMEMSEDSEDSFSESENVNDGNKNVSNEDEEEKKVDENENDLFYWDAYDSENDKGNKKDKYMKVDGKGKSKDNVYGKGDGKNSVGLNGNKDRFIPPLYFQHQGHSRTIIGVIYNKKSKIRHLLVLDPSVKKGGINLLNNIKNGNVQQLLRSKKQVKAAKYQIVAVPIFGIMTSNDRNRCKTIQSMDVTLINKNSKK